MKDYLTAFLREANEYKKDFNSSITILKEIINDNAIQSFLKPKLGKKNIIIETFYTSVLMAKISNVNYKIPSADIFQYSSFTKQGGTAQKSIVIKRIQIVYEAITGQKLDIR